MRLSLISFLLVGCSSSPAWKDNREYIYEISGRTLASLDIANVFSGILIDATLRVQKRPDGNLQCLLMSPKYAQIHSELSEGPLTYIPSAEINWKPLGLSDNAFQIETKRGALTGLIISKETPNWEANIIKGIVSQLQLNISHAYSYQNEISSALFKVMEESVSGNSETLYSLNVVPEHLLINSKIVPMFRKLEEDSDSVLEIIKHKNYTQSIQLPSFVYGLGNLAGTNAATNVMGKFFVRSTTTKALITGNMTQFTIQNSFTINEISMNPTFADNQRASVISMWNATIKKIKSQEEILEDVPNPVRLRSLVYSYGKPYAQSNTVHTDNVKEHFSKFTRPFWQMLRRESDNQEMQDKPQLNHSPECPFLPYTIGNNGRSVKSDMDVVKGVVNLSREISAALGDPNQSLRQNMLSKFINLIKLVQILNEDELKKAAQEIIRDESVSLSVYRDAVAESGSQSALLLIKSWIELRVITREEAAHVVSAMGKSAMLPTSEYIETFFELIKNPAVTSQWPLNETAILTFCELARHVYYDNNFYKTQYPRNSFKNLRDEKGVKFIEEIVMPYFEESLDQAIHRSETSKAHVYIRALAFFGTPDILKAFEPYLEGKKKCSQFQRALMVMGLDRLTKTYPEVACRVLFRIYENIGEVEFLRVISIYQIIRCKPTVGMLQAMSSATKIYDQELVNAAIKSAIQSTARLTNPEFKDLSYAGKMAEHLLTETEYGIHQGGDFLESYFVEHLNLYYKQTIQIYGSSDSFYPSGMKYALRSNIGGIKDQLVNLQALFTSIEQLTRVFYEQTNSYQKYKEQQLQNAKKQRKNPWSSQNVAGQLNMKASTREQLEASIYIMDWNFPYKIFALDNNTAHALPTAIQEWENHLSATNISYVKFINDFESVIAFPTEMGLPFVFSYNAPMFFKVEGSLSARANPKLSQNGKIHKPDNVKITSNIHLTIGALVQGHISFITPFDHQQYYSGFDKTFQAHIPLIGSIDWNLKQKELHCTLKPQKKFETSPLIHYSTRPYTSRRDILDFSSVDLHNRIIKPNHLLSLNTTFGKKETGLVYQVGFKHARNTVTISDWYVLYQKGIIDGFRTLWHDSDIQYSELNVTNLPQESSVDKIEFKLSYDDNYSLKGEGEPLDWEKLSRTEKPSERKEMLMKAASAEIHNVETLAMDASVHFQGEEEKIFIMSSVYAKSNIDAKSRLYYFWKQDYGNGKPFEIKFGSINHVSRANVSNLEDVMSDNSYIQSTMELDIDYEVGDNGKILADVKATRSKERETYLQNEPVYQQCKRDKRTGNTQSSACVNVTVSANYLNQIEANITFSNLNPVLEDVIETVFNHFKYKYYPRLKVDRGTKSESKSNIKLKNKVDSDLRYVNVSIRTFDQETTFKDIALGEFARRLLVLHLSYDVLDRLKSKILEINTINALCVIDQSQVTTFSNWTYKLPLSPHWTVVAQYIPALASTDEQVFNVADQLDSEARNLIILTRQSRKSHTGKDVKIVLSSPETDFEVIEITLEPKQENTGIKGSVMVNKKYITISYSHSKVIEGDYIQIYALPNGEINIEIKNSFYLIYDGFRFKLEATSDMLRGKTRGLCGQFKDKRNEDSLTPQNCFAIDSEKFIRSYETEGEKGDQVRRQFSENTGECLIESMPLYMNVIVHDDTKGFKDSNTFPSKECTKHQTKYVEHHGKICFTIRPIPVCSEHCEAQGYFTKNLAAHCISKSNVTLMWKGQIDNGGNPDFSDKEETDKMQLEVPQSCS